MPGLTESEREAVDDLAARLRLRLGDRLVEIRIYGSKVRETDHAGSDIDLVVIVEHHTPEAREQVFTEVSSVILDYDVPLDVHVMDRPQLRRLQHLGSPYASTIREEGVPL